MTALRLTRMTVLRPGRIRFALIALFALPAMPAAWCQPPSAAVPDKPGARVLHLLASKSPKDVAWGAAEALKHPDDAETDALIALAEDWDGAAAISDDPATAQQHDAMLAVLDTLVQLGGPVPSGVPAAVHGSFPAQALVFAKNLGPGDRERLLSGWFDSDAEANPGKLWEAEGLMLAAEPPHGFAAKIAASVQEDLTLVISSSARPGGGSSTCGDSFSTKPAPGWPELFDYAVTEDNAEGTGKLLAEGGGDRIFAERRSHNEGFGSCSGTLTAENIRYTILAALLGTDTHQMRTRYFMRRRSFYIAWQNAAAYTAQVQKLVAQEEAKLTASVQALQAKGRLTEEEAATVRPKLVLHIRDGRDPGAAALPDIPVTDPRTAFAAAVTTSDSAQ